MFPLDKVFIHQETVLYAGRMHMYTVLLYLWYQITLCF